MGGLFSSGRSKEAGSAAAASRSKAELSVKDRAMLDLKVARDRLDKARRAHEQQKDVFVSKARTLLQNGKKDQAKLALRMKKARQTQLNKINDQLFQLESLVSDVEWAHHQNEIVQGMKAGNLALKSLQLDPDEVENVMLDTQEALDRQREIDDIISQQLNPEDETEVLDELAAIEKEEAQEIASALPEAPKETPQTTTKPATEEAQTSQQESTPGAEDRQAVLA